MVTTRRSTDDDAYIAKNLYCLYLHDLSLFNPARPNRHGILELDEKVRTLVEQGELFATWWDRPERHPFLI